MSLLTWLLIRLGLLFVAVIFSTIGEKIAEKNSHYFVGICFTIAADLCIVLIVVILIVPGF